MSRCAARARSVAALAPVHHDPGLPAVQPHKVARRTAFAEPQVRERMAEQVNENLGREAGLCGPSLDLLSGLSEFRVPARGFEPRTLGLKGRCSARLSYTGSIHIVPSPRTGCACPSWNL